MDNPEKLTSLGTQNTGRRQKTNKQTNKQTNHNTETKKDEQHSPNKIMG